MTTPDAPRRCLSDTYRIFSISTISTILYPRRIFVTIKKITSKATPPPLRIHITHPIHNIRPLNFAEVLSTIPSTQSLLLGWCWCTGFRFWWSWFWTLRWSELFIEADDFDPSCHPLPTSIEEIPMSWRISHAVSYQSFPSVASFVGIYGSLLVMMRTKRL